MRLDRLLAITVMLLNRDRIPAKELSEYFEVSVRTIYRDIDALNLAGIPVVSYQGNNGGIGLVENYKIDRQLLTFDNMLSMITTLKGVNKTFLDKELDNAIEKINSLVPKDKEELLKLHSELYSIDIVPWGYSAKHTEILKKIRQAISESRCISFEYKNLKGESSKRIVEPMTLIFKGSSWYLFCYCTAKNDYRLFKIPRISFLCILDKTFIRKKKSYKELGFFEARSVRSIKLVMKFHPDIRSRVEEFFVDESSVIDDDGFITITTVMPEDEWLYSFLLGYGHYLEIIEPLEIRNLIRERAQGIVRNNSPDPQ